MVSKHTFNVKSKYLAIGFIAILLVLSVYLGVALKKSQGNTTLPPAEVNKTKEKVSMVGKMTCLPRIPGQNGSIMADCAYGFIAEDGRYYLLDDPSNGKTSNFFENPLYTAEKLMLKGVLTNETSEEFEVSGKITLESFTVIEPGPTTDPEFE